MGFDLLPDFNSLDSIVVYLSSIGVQAFIFLLTLLVLSSLVFYPVTRILYLRRKNIEEFREKAGEYSEKNRVMEEEYRWRMEGAVQLASEQGEIAKIMAKYRAEMVMADAKEESLRRFDETIRLSLVDYENARPVLEKKVEGFAGDIVNRLLTA